MDDKILVIGNRIRERRESLPQKLSMETLGKRLGCTKQTISKWELDEAPYISQQQLTNLCNILDCTEAYLRGDSNHPYANIIISENGTSTELTKPFRADTNKSYYMKLLQEMSTRKLYTIDLIINSLMNCEDRELDCFDRLVKAYFEDKPQTGTLDTISLIERHIKDNVMPEITLSAIRHLHSSKFEQLNEHDWNNSTFHNSMTQCLGDYMKATKRTFPLALERSINETLQGTENTSIESITESSIEYLSDCIEVYLKNYANNEGLYHKQIPLNKYKELKSTFPKYLTRDIQSYLTPWKQLLTEFLESYVPKESKS